MRIFYAVQFPDFVKQAMADNMREIKKHADRGSFTPRDNFHVTLVFIGECEPHNLEYYKKAADLTVNKLKPLSIQANIDGLGSFKRADGDILWAAMQTEPENILSEINNNLIAELRGLNINIKQEHDKFVPHVTIARKFSGDLSRVNFTPVNFSINSIVIMESIFSNGVIYRPLYESKFYK